MAKVPFPCCCGADDCNDYGGTWYIKFCNYTANTDGCAALEQLEGTELSFAAPSSAANSTTNTQVDLGADYGCDAAGVLAPDLRYWRVEVLVGEAAGNVRSITVWLYGYADGDYNGSIEAELKGVIASTCSGVFDTAFEVSFRDLGDNPISTSATIDAIVSKSSSISC